MKYIKLIGLFTVVLLYSCSKVTEEYSTISLNEVYPLAVGKVFIYRLDSTLPVNFGKKFDINSYTIKDSIESSFYDTLGQLNYRVFRYINDTTMSQTWKYSATNYITLANNRIEYVENNQRFIKLVSPVSTNVSWKGNSYINTPLPSPFYYLDDWNYRYTNLHQPFTTIKQVFDTTYTVSQVDEQTPANFDPTVYNDKRFSKEVYAKNVGLVYKEFLFYIWQSGTQTYQDDSYGVKLNLIDYR